MIDYISPDRFAVTIHPDDSDIRKLGVVDGRNNLLYGSMDGFLSGTNNFQNFAQQAVFGMRSSGQSVSYGVLDAQLNVIIPAEYDRITIWSEENENQFYVVEQGKDRYAVFDSRGKQMTPFEHSSVYDMQTAYFAKLEEENKD